MSGLRGLLSTSLHSSVLLPPPQEAEIPLGGGAAHPRPSGRRWPSSHHFFADEEDE